VLIRFTGNASVVAADREAARALLDGYESSESMLEHIESLPALGLDGGTIKLKHVADADKFQAITEFRFPHALSETQLKDLTRAVTGQWSDGLGSGCFEEIAAKAGAKVNIRRVTAKEPVAVEQIDDGVAVPRRFKVYFAARAGNLSEVVKLLDDGEKIDESFAGGTPLFSAILMGQLDAARTLIERGADVFAAKKSASGHAQGPDCLMATATSNRLRDNDAATLARLLVAKGVSPNGQRDGMTVLTMARHRKKLALEAALIELGATG
jgi:ankyrin repeat protein